jgi:hypothetical protein
MNTLEQLQARYAELVELQEEARLNKEWDDYDLYGDCMLYVEDDIAKETA